MSPFSIIPTLRSGAPTPQLPHPPTLEEQWLLVARARRLARQWLLRSVLLLVIGATAVRWGWLFFGLALFALALLGLQLSRSTGRRAAELEAMLPPREPER